MSYQNLRKAILQKKDKCSATEVECNHMQTDITALSYCFNFTLWLFLGNINTATVNLTEEKCVLFSSTKILKRSCNFNQLLVKRFRLGALVQKKFIYVKRMRKQ